METLSGNHLKVSERSFKSLSTIWQPYDNQKFPKKEDFESIGGFKVSIFSKIYCNVIPNMKKV